MDIYVYMKHLEDDCYDLMKDAGVVFLFNHLFHVSTTDLYIYF